MWLVRMCLVENWNFPSSKVVVVFFFLLDVIKLGAHVLSKEYFNLIAACGEIHTEFTHLYEPSLEFVSMG